MGVVYEATHNRLDKRVAIKVLNPAMTATPEFVQRFEREARAASQLKSRHVAHVEDVAETDEGLPYMVMEFLDGHDLAVELEQRGTFPIDEAVNYVLQACTAMAEAHDLGIVHRDLKPANLFVCREDDEVVVRVLDFGISKITSGSSTLTATAASFGTPLYMSPEQVRSVRTVDARTDIWSLGIIAYEMISGHTPFVGNSATATIASIVADDVPPLKGAREAVPEELARVVHKALAKNVAERYADVRAFGMALAPFSSHGTAVKLLRRPSLASSPYLSLIPPGAGDASPNAATVPAEAASGPLPTQVTMPITRTGVRRATRTVTGIASVGAVLTIASAAYFSGAFNTTPLVHIPNSATVQGATLPSAEPPPVVIPSATSEPLPSSQAATVTPVSSASAHVPIRSTSLPPKPHGAKPIPPPAAPTNAPSLPSHL